MFLRQSAEARFGSSIWPLPLLDLLRLYVGPRIECAIGYVLGGASRGFDDIVHFLQRSDIGGLEARDVRAVPLGGVGAVDPGMSPDGRYLYVNESKIDAVGGFAVSGGNLTELPGSPTALPAGATPAGIAVS